MGLLGINNPHMWGLLIPKPLFLDSLGAAPGNQIFRIIYFGRVTVRLLSGEYQALAVARRDI